MRGLGGVVVSVPQLVPFLSSGVSGWTSFAHGNSPPFQLTAEKDIAFPMCQGVVEAST